MNELPKIIHFGGHHFHSSDWTWGLRRAAGDFLMHQLPRCQGKSTAAEQLKKFYREHNAQQRFMDADYGKLEQRTQTWLEYDTMEDPYITLSRLGYVPHTPIKSELFNESDGVSVFRLRPLAKFIQIRVGHPPRPHSEVVSGR